MCERNDWTRSTLDKCVVGNDMVGSIVRWECVSDLEGNCAFVVGVIVVRDFVVESGVRMADMWRTAV